MEKIDERNLVNRLAGIEHEQKLQRAQLIGLLATMILLGVGLYKIGKAMPV